MSGGGSDKQVTKVQVPGFLRPFAQQGAQAAGGALSGLESRLTGATAEDLVAPLNQLQLDIGSEAAEGGLSDIQDRLTGVATGQAGGPGFEALESTARGDFLFGGEGFDAAVDAAFRSAQPRIFSQFGGAGRLDSGLAREAIASAFADPFAAQFGQERSRQINAANTLLGRQLQASQLAPSLAQQRFGIGTTLQNQAQRELVAPITAQQQLLAASGGAIPAGAFLGSSATAPQGGPSPLVAGLGGAATGAAAGAQIGAAGGPIGAGTGALIGGGIGLLSAQ